MERTGLRPIQAYLQRAARAVEAAHLSDSELLGRFTASADEVAFTVLVRRHGPMVLAVCRRVLRDSHEAEDAFQATFLLLVRKARLLHRPDLLGPWLHGVAYRTATRGRTLLVRRRMHEQAFVEPATRPASDEADWRDLKPILDEAILRLPAKYRLPFVLCYLEGRTYAQAAAQLRCPAGTIATRLSRAKDWLRKRLAGFDPLAPTPMLAVTLPPGLLSQTVLSAAATLVGGAAAVGVVPTSVATLTKGIGKAMLMEKFKVVLFAVLLASALGGGGLLYQARSAGVAAVSTDDVATTTHVALSLPTEQPDDELESVCRTANFVVHAPTRRIAQLVTKTAEEARKERSEFWFGRALPDWKEACLIEVKIVPAGGSGASTMNYQDGRVLTMKMMVQGSLEKILLSQVPHEVTHLLWANALGAPVPRWADEGAAILAEDKPDQQQHDKLVREVLNQGRAIPLRRLFERSDYPSDAVVLFAEGYSVTRYLVGRKDPRTFFEFVKKGSQAGWDAAVKSHFGFGTVSDLERAWLASLRRGNSEEWLTPQSQSHPSAPVGIGTVPTASIVPPPPLAGDSPISPDPFIARARAEEGGHILIRRMVHYCKPVTKNARVEGEQGVYPITSFVYTGDLQEQQFGADEISAYRINGDAVVGSRLLKLLDKECGVLICSDRKKIDPLHLQVIKPETLILKLKPRLVPPQSSLTIPAVPSGATPEQGN